MRAARWQRQLDEARALEAISDIESDNAARALLDAEQVNSSTTILKSEIFLLFVFLGGGGSPESTAERRQFSNSSSYSKIVFRPQQ